MSTTTTYTGVRIVDMPDLGAVTNDSSVVGEHAGSGRFSALALSKYLGGGGTYSIRDFGAKSDGVTDDCNAVTSAIAAILALPHGGKLIIPAGRTVVGCPLPATIPAGVTLTIEGMGTGASELYFSTASDGINFKLANAGATWGSVHLRNLTITRGPASPVAANTGINIYIDPAAGRMYNGNSSLRDLFIAGSTPTTNQWSHSVILSGVSTCPIDNVTIQAANATATDQGDVCLTLSGPNVGQFGVSYTVINTAIVGGSVGVLIDKYVQGAFISNSTIIGNYDSIRWLGAGPVINHTTTATTAAGNNVLHFAANSLSGIAVGDIVNGTNIPSQARVSAVNSAAGTLTIGASNVTGAGVASGATIAIQPYYIAEDVSVIGCSLNGGHRGVYTTWGAYLRVIGTTILRFPTGTANWAGVEFNEGNYNNASTNNILGNSAPTEYGILFSSTGYQGTVGSTCIGNNLISCQNGGIYLQGTTAGATVSGNTVSGGANAIVQDVAGANAIGGNTWNAAQLPLNITASPAAGAAITINGAPADNRQLAILSNNLTRWSLTSVGGTEGGGNAGSNFGIYAYNDAGAPLYNALTITRSNGVVTLATAPTITAITAAANDAAAAGAGVPVGGLYRSASALMVRVV